MADRQFIDFRNDSLLDSLKKSETNFTSLFSLAKTVKLTANKTVVTYGEQGTTEGDTILLTITPRGFDLSNTFYEFVVGGYTSELYPADDTTGDFIWELPDNLEPTNEQSIVVTVNAYEGDTAGENQIVAFDSVTITGIQGLFEGVVGADGADGTDAKVVKLTANQYVIRYSESGSEGDSITFTAETQGFTGSPYYKFTKVDTSEVLQNTTDNVLTLDDEDEPQLGEVITVKVDVSETQNGTILATDSVSIYAVQDGSDAIIAFLTNASHVVPASSDGTIESGVIDGSNNITGAGGTFKVFVGATEVTTGNGCVFTESTDALGIASIDANTGVYTISSVGFNENYSSIEFQVEIPASVAKTQSNVTIEAVYTIAKSNAGVNGLNGQDAVNAVLDLTNDRHSVAADNSGTVTDDYSTAFTYVDFYLNGSEIFRSASWSDSLETISGYDDIIEATIGGETWIMGFLKTNTDGGWNEPVSTPINRFDVSSLTADTGTITFQAIRDPDGDNESFIKVMTLTKVKAGTPARSVRLTADQYAVRYDEFESENDTITLTASAQGFSDPWYQFLVNGNSRQFNNSSDFYVLEDTYAYQLEPEVNGVTNVEVKVFEGGIGSALASDSVTIYGIQDGVDAYTVILSNDSHVIQTDSAGDNGVYTSSGTSIYVYKGNVELEGVVGTTPTLGEFSVSASGTNITVGTQTADVVGGGITFGDHNTMNADNAYIEYTINIENVNSVVRRQSFSKSKAGNDAVIYSIAGNYSSVLKLENNTFTPSTLEFTAKKRIGNGSLSNVDLSTESGELQITVFFDGLSNDTSQFANSGSTVDIDLNNDLTSNQRDKIQSIKIDLSIGGSLVDSEIIPVVNDGTPGAGLVYRGTYDSGTTYYHTDKRRDVVLYSGTYYITNNEDKNALTTWGTPPTDWEEFSDTFDSVATDLLLANDVGIINTLVMGTLDPNLDPASAVYSDDNGIIRHAGAVYQVDGSPNDYYFGRGFFLNSNGDFYLGGSNTANTNSGTGTYLLFDTSTNDLIARNASIEAGSFTAGSGNGLLTINSSGIVFGESGAFRTIQYDEPSSAYVDTITFSGTNVRTSSYANNDLEETYYYNGNEVMKITGTSSGGTLLLKNSSGVNKVQLYGVDGDATFAGIVTATGGFSGDLTGNADTATVADTIFIGTDTTDTFFPIPFVDGSLDGADLKIESSIDCAIRFNPSTQVLYVGDDPNTDGGIASGVFYSNNYYSWSGGTTYYLRLNDATTSMYTNGSINVNGTTYTSDERLKNIIGNISNPIDKIKSLNGFYYTNNDNAKELGYTNNSIQVGVSAQDVQTVLPEVVFDHPLEDNDYKTVDYTRLVPLLIEAIKEQQTQIESLQEQINALSGT